MAAPKGHPPYPGCETGGRPTVFTPEITAIILQRIADGESVRAICRDDAMPSLSAFFRWVSENDKFREQYDAATDVRAEAIFEEALEIADTVLIGEKVKTSGEGESLKVETQTGDMVERARLKVDTRKWFLSKLKPKRYGERLDLNHSGNIDLSVTDRLKEARERALNRDVASNTTGVEK
jgi:hypothetical protein